MFFPSVRCVAQEMGSDILPRIPGGIRGPVGKGMRRHLLHGCLVAPAAHLPRGSWPRLSMSDIRKTGALHDLWAATRLEGSLHVRHHIGGAQPGRSHTSSMVDRWGGGLHHPGTFSREAEPFTSPGWVSSSRYEAVLCKLRLYKCKKLF